jgi:hypothetical protein
MQTEKNREGGVKASRECSKNHSKEIEYSGEKVAPTYVKYKDHVLFRNCDSSEMKPSIREVVGWLAFENSEAMCICSDKPVEPLRHEKSVESGVVILKSDVLEKHELESGKAFKRTRIAHCGQKKSPVNGEEEKCKS